MRLLRSSSARPCGATEAEAVEDVAVAGIVPVAVRGAAEPGAVVPAAPAQDTVVARGRSCRVYDIPAVVTIPVSAPLIDIPVHVAESPWIRTIAADQRGLHQIGPLFKRAARIVTVAVRPVTVQVVPPVVGGRRLRPSSLSGLPIMNSPGAQ